MLEIADIFRQYGDEYLGAFGKAMPSSHRRAFRDILSCRTQAMGGHLFVCDHCGREHYAYHSCRNRSCPKCHGRDMQDWLQDRHKELLPVRYFHIVFTLPQELRAVVRRYQKILYSVFMKAAAKSLMELAYDPHYLGGRIGLMAVLHTWTRTLTYHPHVHCLVPGGGVSDKGQWLRARKNHLVPVKALSKLFRGKFMALAASKLPDVKFPQAAWNQPWVVYCKPAVQGSQNILNYLGRYVHRVAITNSRILSISNGKVTFRYQNCGQSQWKTMTLTAQEFIRRFLQHVLPKAVHKVRYYGLWAPSNRRLLYHIQTVLGIEEPSSPPDTSDKPTDGSPAPAGQPCPHCGQGILLWVRRIPRQAPLERAPP